MTSVQIALATYQGARFLPAQLDSLFAQSYADFSILIADDGSTDGSRTIIADYMARYPGRIRLLSFGDPAGSALGNFRRLADHLDADYAMFCDQDDVWLPDKISRSLAAMRSAEACSAAATPVLVHTDMIMADAKLAPVRASFWRATRMDPTRRRLREILVENSTAGCTMLANRPLYQLARPIPPQATMHDHWLALVAAAFGRIEYLDRGTLMFRRHDANSSDHPVWRTGFVVRRLIDVARGRGSARDMERFAALTDQAAAFGRRYGGMLSQDQRAAVEILATLSATPRALRVPRLLRHRLLKSDWRRNLLMFSVVWRGERSRSNP